MKIVTKKFNKLVISILILAIFFSFPFLTEAAAGGSMSRGEQEEKTAQCKGPENPVGEMLDTAIEFSAELNSILSQIIYDSKQIFKYSDDLAGVASGCNKKRCGIDCNRTTGNSQCCSTTVETLPDGSTTTVCTLSCNTLACSSKCGPPPCGVNGMKRIDSDLSTVQHFLSEVKQLQKQYERTLVSYFNIYEKAFGQTYACVGAGGICREVDSTYNGNVYINDKCNYECPQADQVKGYGCVAPSSGSSYQCKAVGKNFSGSVFSTMSDCQSVCGQSTYKCNPTSGKCDEVYDGSGITSSSTCQANCTKGMTISPLAIAPLGECDSRWATTSLGSSTICAHGDSLTDVAMMVNYCGKNMGVDEVLENIKKKNGTILSNGDINWDIAACPCRGRLGLEEVSYNAIKGQMKDNGYTDALKFIQDRFLNQGSALVVECDPSLGSSQQEGYYSILLKGYDSTTKTVYYNDPKTGTAKTMTALDYYNTYHCYSDKTTGKEALILTCLRP